MWVGIELRYDGWMKVGDEGGRGREEWGVW